MPKPKKSLDQEQTAIARFRDYLLRVRRDPMLLKIYDALPPADQEYYEQWPDGLAWLLPPEELQRRREVAQLDADLAEAERANLREQAAALAREKKIKEQLRRNGEVISGWLKIAECLGFEDRKTAMAWADKHDDLRAIIYGLGEKKSGSKNKVSGVITTRTTSARVWAYKHELLAWLEKHSGETKKSPQKN